AQETVGSDSTVVYPASYFTEWDPVSAMDMVNRIPGISVGGGGGGGNFRPPGGGNRNAGSGGRGFGGGSGGGTEILINGKRTAGKDNNTQSQLARINAEQVNSIELIRGTGGDLDVRGSGQIVNIILFESLDTSSLSFDVVADYYKDSESRPGGTLTYSDQYGNLNMLVSAAATPQYDHTVAYEESILGDGSANDLVFQDTVVKQTNYSLSTNLDYTFNPNSSARLNALYARNDNPSLVDRTTVDIRNGAYDPYVEFEDIPGRQRNWEIGGDYEYNFANGARLKALFIANENDTGSTRERFEVLDGGGMNKNLYLDSQNVIEERILRGSYTFDIFDGQDLELGGERAQTTLDAALKLGTASGSGSPAASHGGLIPVAVDNANTTVEEIRYEPFAIHNWRINQRMSLETSLVYEYSEIEQSGDFSNKRDFSFFKPKFDYRFDVTPTLQLRFLVEKFVRQMSFTNFVASTDADDNDSDTLAGNKFLRPDYWWNYNFTAEYRLPDDQGVVSANIYKHRHKDFLQRIDVSPSADNLQSAAGNVGTGEMYVIDLKASVRLTRFGLPNVLVNASLGGRDSEMIDPFTNQERSFTIFHRGEFELGFRHDI
ncbi:MAG: TonB-dependent receptor plug domain-containing protein, partial [Gammaproteobacteria bacterium]